MRISDREWHSCFGRYDQEQLIRNKFERASLGMVNARIRNRYGGSIERLDSGDYALTVEGEPAIDLAIEHRDEWAPR